MRNAQDQRRKSRTILGVGLLLTLSSTACGTRVVAPAADTASSPSYAGGAALSSGEPAVATSVEAPTVAESRAANTANATATPTKGTSTPKPASAGGAAPPQGGNQPTAGAPRAATPSGRAPTNNASAGGGPSAADITPGAGRPSPVLFASVGTYGGPAGAVEGPILQGAQIWVRNINHNGGLNGHEVTLIVYDDGGDAARHRAQVQEAVEQRKILGFLMSADALTGRASVDYITKNRVPVIGVDGGLDFAYISPMYFPQISSGEPLLQSYPSAVAAQAIPKGKTVLGTVVCVEATFCSSAERIFSESAGRVGFKYPYRAKVSLAQPDFTAECLSAHNAGVDVLFVASDMNSIGRLAASCARQGFHPMYAIVGQGTADRLKDDPNLNDLVSIQPAFPYVQSGTPATDEFQLALRSFGQRVDRGPGLSIGWIAGKVLERAGAHLPEPATRETLLAGLWSIKNDSMGGLGPPLTFVQDKPATPTSCWFTVLIKDHSWISPDGFHLQCV